MTSPVHYQTFTMNKPTGTLSIHAMSDSQWRAEYEYSDRGRGPKLGERVTVDKHGISVQHDVSGYDYWKAAVDETFTRTDTGSRWQNGVDDNSTTSTTPAFYIPLHGTPMATALLAQALLDAPDRTLPLLPAGQARLDEVARARISANGMDRQVVLYAIAGLDLSPTHIWLDADTRQMVAITESWSQLAQRGWESAVPMLRDKQREVAVERLHEMAQRLPLRPEGRPVVFRRVAIFDSNSGKRQENMMVVVAGSRIERVAKEGAFTPDPQAIVIDGTGHTLLPGLWDMHTHASHRDGALQLAAGVTSMRDLANDIDEVTDMRAGFDSGKLMGPRMILAGFMDGTSEYTGPTKVIVDTEAQAKSAIERYAKLGYEQIKIYSSIKPALVPYIVDTAHAAGLRVSGHIPAFMTADQAIAHGYDEIQHANFLILNFLFHDHGVEDTRTPLRFTAVGEHAATLDLSSERVQAFVQLLKRENVVVDPTLAIFEGMFVARKGKMSPGFAAAADAFPVGLRRVLLTGGLPVPDGMDERYRSSFDTLVRLIGMLHRAGVRLVAGTDSLVGYTLHRELELYAKAGISASDVLRLATLEAAQLTKRDDVLGSIEPGKHADLVLVAGRPSENISDIRRTALTVKDGVLFEPRAIYREFGIEHPTPPPAITRP